MEAGKRESFSAHHPLGETQPLGTRRRADRRGPVKKAPALGG